MEIYRGLVLAERSAGEQGKFIDVLTEHNTVQEIYVRGAKRTVLRDFLQHSCFPMPPSAYRNAGISGIWTVPNRSASSTGCGNPSPV